MLERNSVVQDLSSSPTRQLQDFEPAGEELGSTLNRERKMKVLRLDFSWAKHVGARGLRIVFVDHWGPRAADDHQGWLSLYMLRFVEQTTSLALERF